MYYVCVVGKRDIDSILGEGRVKSRSDRTIVRLGFEIVLTFTRAALFAIRLASSVVDEGEGGNSGALGRT